MEFILNWNFNLYWLYDESLQTDLLIKISMKYVQINQNLPEKLSLQNQKKSLWVLNFKHKQPVLIQIQK